MQDSLLGNLEEEEKEVGVACPLLGAGAKGAPPDEAIAVALEALELQPAGAFHGRLCFTVIDDTIADFFAERLQERSG